MLINVSRGNIINEDDLLFFLNKQKFSGVALDVFSQEPLQENNPLWNSDKIIITPHNSWFSDIIYDRRFDLIFKNTKNFIDGHDLINIIKAKEEGRYL